jgi:hypothetical protein
MEVTRIYYSHLVIFRTIGHHLRQFGIAYGHLVYFGVIW